ncbi:MAG: hypothetical protein J7L42_07010 [Elusimicrobia bacterium]|nr:hypothetical protein [Elusimicrobiota bacterium]
MKYIQEYLKFKKERKKQKKKLISSAKIINPIVVFWVAVTIFSWIFAILNIKLPQKVERNKPLLELKLFNVGHGNSLFIKTPKGKIILVDAGPSSKKAKEFCLPENASPWKNVIKRSFKDVGIKKIDILILTSPLENFCGGAEDLIKDGFKVEKVIATKNYFPGPRFIPYRSVLSKFEEKGILKFIKAGDIIFKEGNFLIQVLSPLVDYSGLSNYEYNASMVLRIVYGNTAVVYGSSSFALALNHIASYKNLESDILITPYHSSSRSFSLSFLQKLSCNFCLISSGRGNKEDLPDAGILAIYDVLGIKYLRTDTNGTIRIISDGKIYEIETEY